MRSDILKRHMLQHEKEKYEMESLCSSSIATSRTSLQEETESNISLDTTKTYEISPLKSEELIKTMIKDDEEYKYNVAWGKKNL